MHRREFIQKTLAGVALAGLSGVGTDLLAAAPVRLTILHTNDMHSRIEPFPDDGRKHGGTGGMARRAALIKQVRQQEEHVLLLDAGDIFQGTPYFNFFGGELEFKMMSDMGYDVATLGNHDFDNGLPGLEKQLPHAKFPFITANYDFSKTILKDRFQPYKVFARGPLKIGVFGLGIELAGLVPDKLYAETVYQDPVPVAREMVQELRRQRCDLIICLSHLGYKYNNPEAVSDHVLARQVEGIDLIIGGHTHTFLEKPTELTGPEGKPVLINQVGWAGINLGRIDFEFQRGRRKKNTDASVLNVSEKTGV
jgi:5'-nucleotidase